MTQMQTNEIQFTDNNPQFDPDYDRVCSGTKQEYGREEGQV